MRVTFNGFDVEKGTLQKIIEVLLRFKNLNNVHLHTNQLRNTSVDDFKAMLHVIEVFGADINC